MSEYRGNQCPDRGAGLSHMQDAKVLPDGRCLYCGVPVDSEPPDGVPDTATEAGFVVAPDIFDHLFVFSITGRCARCGSHKDKHVTFLIGTDKGDCTVDHRSVMPWTQCGICQAYVEPKMTDGNDTIGPKYGKGRMPVTERMRNVWDTLYHAWVGGYYKS